MASITFDVSGDIVVRNVPAAQVTQQEGFQIIVNAQRAELGLPPFTVNEYLDFILTEAVKSHRERYANITAKERIEAYKDANQATKDQIDTLLGL